MKLSLSLLVAFSACVVASQGASISKQKIAMKTYMFSDPDPVPDTEKNYPYFRFDGYTNRSTMKEWTGIGR